MNKRLALATLVVLLIIGGMISALFIGPIQRALTVPVMRMMENNPQGQAGAQKPQPAPTAGHQDQNGQPGKNTTQKQNPNQNLNPNQNPNMTNTTQAQNGVPPNAIILAQDTFQRANQPLWGTASDGRQWGGDANVQQSFSVTNATGQIANAQGALNALLGTPTTDAEVVAGGSVNSFADGVNLGVVLRWNDSKNWYKALIDGKHLQVLKNVNGQTTQIGSVAFTAQPDRVYMLRFRTIGAMLFVKSWRSDQVEPKAWMITTSDPDLMSGRAGLRVVLQPNTVINITTFSVIPAVLADSTL